jgi:hypothetical protein
MGNRLLIAHLAVVALLVLGVTTLVFDFAVSRAAGIVAFSLGAVIIIGFWVVLPRLRPVRGEDDGARRTLAEDADGDVEA